MMKAKRRTYFSEQEEQGITVDRTLFSPGTDKSTSNQEIFSRGPWEEQQAAGSLIPRLSIRCLAKIQLK